ncbi:MAG TPA: hypothetical protein VJJ75_03620 [Candidatus Nanoarchaeia archaeon]|nr:hypothetical protein [Candidatus Nanoarchaeia archaeon]
MLKYVREDEEAVLKMPQNLSAYIRLSGTPFVIAREQSHNNLDFDATDAALKEEGLFMPSPAIFMPYRNQVIKAAIGDVRLCDGTGKMLTKEEAKDVAKPLTAHCQAWLYAIFADQQGKTLITYNRIKNKDTIEEVTEALQLERNITDGSLVDLVFNEQGMPVRKSREKEYHIYYNIYFCFPLDGSVAGFSAVTDGACLSCGGGRRVSDSALGVFACAAGA